MGLDKFAAELMAVSKFAGCSFDRVLTLGRQSFYIEPTAVSRVEEICGFPVEDLFQQGGEPGYTEGFFERLGASRIESMDYSDYEGASVIHDLNEPIASAMEEKYSVVFDGGTLEHVFHFPNAIKNCMRMLEVGGWFLSVSPSNNWNGHGFYQFSPELFYRVFGTESGFEVKLMGIAEEVSGGRLYRVEDGAILGKRVSMNGRYPASIVFAAKKLRSFVESSTGNPGQSDYVATWGGERTADSPNGKAKRALINNLGKILPRPIKARLLERWKRMRREKHGMEGVSRVASMKGCLR